MLQKQNNNTDIARILIAIIFTHAPCPFLIKTNKQNPNQNTNQEKTPKHWHLNIQNCALI